MDVCILGSINVDIVLGVAELPRAGETVLAQQTERFPGGKGANQAVAAARMGAATAMVGAVGDDAGGAWMLETLRGAGVDVGRITALSDADTGTAYIAVDGKGENQIIVAAGANGALEPDPGALPAGGVLLAQLEIPLPVVAEAFRQARPLRILNAAPAVPQAAAIFADVDLLIVNQHELGVYLGGERIEGPRAALKVRGLFTRADQAAIVTLGAEGAVAVWNDRACHVTAPSVTAIDTVGAGDCFCGAIAALLAEGRTIEQALPLANAAAALCTQRKGAIPAIPERAQAEAFAIEHARTIKTLSALDLS